MKKLLFAATIASGAFLVPQAASAALVFDSTISITANGFGNHPRLLTIHGGSTESGCVKVGGSGSTLVGGSGACDGTLFANLGGDEASPLSDNQKFGIPTITELGWASAGDIGLLLTAVEPGGNSINVDDITLKFYNGTSLIAQVNGSHNFASTDPGNGKAGFVFVADSASQTYLNQSVFGLQGFGSFRIALESTFSNAGGGPDSWAAVNLAAPPPVPEPATWAMMLGGFGLLGATARRRRRPTVAFA